MKQYSQIIVPFKRVSDAPMELDYKFETVEDLKVWASENLPILHAGLLKIVENPSSKKIDFYTFQEIPNESSSAVEAKNFELVKLLSTDDINDINTDILDITDQLTAIWGVQDPSNIEEAYNSIKKIADRIVYINEQIAKIKILHQTDKAIAGYAGDDVMEYLTTIKYGSLTALSKALNDFLNTSSEEGSDIRTWEDLRNFLTGYKNNKSLKDVINEITGGTIRFENTDTIEFERLELKDGIQVKASVKLGTGVNDTDLNIRNDNMLIVKNGGLFYNMQIRDTGKALRFIVNGSIVHIFEYEDIYKNAFGVDDITYDNIKQCIVVVFKNGEKLEIPFSLVFHGVDVDNTAGSGVKLDISKSGGKGIDIISASAEISNEPNNGIMLKDDGLFMSKDSNDITYGNVSVAHALDKLSEKIDNASAETIEELKNSVKDLQQADKDIQTNLDNAYKDLNGKISTLETNVTNSITNTANLINQTIEENKAAAEAAIADVQTNLDAAKEELYAEIVKNREELDAKDEDLDIKITNAIADVRKEFNAADKTISDDLNFALNATNLAYKAADEEIVEKINGLSDKLNATINETNLAYQEADKAINTRIDELTKSTSDKDAELLNTLNEQIASLRTDVSSSIDQLRKDIAASLTQMKDSIVAEMTAKITEAIEAHVQEHHTFVETGE